MKKIIALLMIAVMGLSLVACGSSESSTETIEDKIVEGVKGEIMYTIAFTHETQGVPHITYYVDKINNKKYSVSGKVTVKDKYGDSYTGKYDATAKYDATLDDVVVDLDLRKLYKN